MENAENMIYPGKEKKGMAYKNKGVVFLALVLITLMSSACYVKVDDPWDHSPLYTTEIISDQDADGDIRFTPPDVYAVSSASTTGSVFVGIDPDYGDEYRGFLDFYLDGPDGVPLRADIESATLSIFVSNVYGADSRAGVPLLIDLVYFQPPNLIPDDYNRTIQPPLLSMPVEIRASDEGTFVDIDITPLMMEVQIEALPDLQLRLLLDTFATSGFVEIEDNAVDTAPLLIVTYY